MRRWALASLVVTALLGTLLRLGWTAPPFSVPLTGHPGFLRHAHSHLGFYAVVFPTLWLSGRGWSPRGRWAHAYAALCALTAGAFLWGGYWLASILGSALVGLTWGVFAVRGGLRFWRPDARSAVGAAVLLALCFVPPIGLLTHRDPALADELVRTFLSLLLLGAGLPVLLRGPRSSGGLWLLAAGLAAAGAGLHWPLPRAAGYLGLALLMVGHLRRRFDPLLGPQWLLAAGGFVAYAVGLMPPDRASSIAGAHFLLLGPVACTLLFRTRRAPTPQMAWLYVLLVWLMCASIALMGRGLADELGLQRVAAASGACLTALLLAFTLRRWRRSDEPR